ncbi:MAG: hypothetical protein U0893_16340 [Chloroflexota bacterium]
MDIVAKPGRLVWNAFATNRLGEWVGAAPLDDPALWRLVRRDKAGPAHLRPARPQPVADPDAWLAGGGVIELRKDVTSGPLPPPTAIHPT